MLSSKLQSDALKIQYLLEQEAIGFNEHGFLIIYDEEIRVNPEISHLIEKFNSKHEKELEK